jgi:uncharacterized membrane protein YkoI
MKYVLQIVFAITSASRFVRETTDKDNNQLRRLRVKKTMKKTIAAIAIALVGSLAFPLFLTAAEENEETVQMSSLPEAAQKTIKDKAGSKEIERIEKKTENGQTVYEAVVKKSGKEWSIEVDANGKFLKQYQENEEKEKGEKN